MRLPKRHLPQESTVAAEEQQTDETETDNGQTDASSPDPGTDAEEAPGPSEAQTEERPEEEPPEEENTEEPPAENASEDAESVIEQLAEENEPYTFDGEILYADMPDAPTGSYIGSYGLPVATGETKIGLGAWNVDLEQDQLSQRRGAGQRQPDAG